MTDLLVQLNNDPDAGEAEVLAYLGQRAQEAERDGLAVFPGAFWQPGDLDKYRALRDWWPTDAPPLLGRPYLGVLLRAYAYPANRPPPLAFGQELERMWGQACQWLNANKRSLENPNETKEERRRRRTREAVARHRVLASSDDPRANEVKRLHAEYMEACAKRKAAAAAHDKDVMDAYKRWENAKEELARG